MEYEEREILNHGLIGGLIAVALVSFHELADVVSKWWFQGKPVRLAIALLLLLYFVAFATIIMVEFYLRRRSWKAKIKLPDFGCIDGKWIDVVIEEGRVIGGGIIEIKSAAGEGFQLDGTTYVVGAAGIEKTSPGNWKTIHGRLFGKDGIAYVYQGDTPAGEKHFGVGYYQFFLRSPDARLRFEGGFLAKQKNIASHALGLQLSSNINAEEAFAILCDYVTHADVIAFAHGHRDIPAAATVSMPAASP